MRLDRCTAAILITLCLGASTAMAELKIGFIDSEEIFQKYEGTKEAQERFNREVAKWEQQAEEAQKEIREMKEQLEKQSLLLSKERKAELENKLQEKMLEYQKFVQTTFGQEGQAIKKNTELTKPIIDRINNIIDKIAKEEKYDFILDTRAGGIVFAKTGYDLTARVLDMLNKE
ncbi:MAG: OmpH family outer membrane protein [Chitinivibrionales bacterium]|nr:OmpH family outer membrane protein [Chitinivibrionales bacterium]